MKLFLIKHPTTHNQSLMKGDRISIETEQSTPKQLLKTVIFTLGILATAISGLPADSSNIQDERPNIILILTDDQRWDALGCSGNPIIQTPNMDRLAKNGVRFENAFVNSPVCAASRASILTGLHERTHKFTFGTSSLNPVWVDMSYPSQLRRAGYRTGFIGKLGVFINPADIEKMFDYFQPTERNPYLRQVEGKPRHLTEIHGDLAQSLLSRFTSHQPFQLTISFHAPHAVDGDPQQYYWPSAVNHFYENIHIPPPNTSDPSFFKQQPEFLKTSLNRVRWGWRFDTPEKYQRMVKGYYRMISGVDMVIGRIITELLRLGLHRNTIIILTSDNGYFLGERGYAGKWLMHEPSIRVPLIIYDPRREKIHRNHTEKRMVLNIDIAPTMLDLACVNLDGVMHGKSLVPLLSRQQVQWRSEIFCEHLYEHAKIPQSEGMRTSRWKYIRYPKHPEFKELYDLKNDPLEAHNLIHYTEYQKLLFKLDQRCNQTIQKLK